MSKHTSSDDLEKLVKEIMQSGFDVAMGGTPFKSEEENRADQEKAYDETVEKNAQSILAYIKSNYILRARVANAIGEIEADPEVTQTFIEGRAVYDQVDDILRPGRNQLRSKIRESLNLEGVQE